MSAKIIVKGYQVGAQIDQSGLRTIYKATHVVSGKQLFLTVVSVRPGRSLNNLMRRAQQSRRLTLPGLVPAVDYGILPDDRFFYTHSANLSKGIQEYLSSVGEDEERLYTMARLFNELLELVDYIHEAGTTHRDLSTGHLRVDAQGGAVLEGFINARPKVEARNLVNIVNMPYMAPEQLMNSSPADKKTDIYSLGIILYELITGKVPYESNYKKVEDARQGIVPMPSQHRMDLPQELEAICLKALSSRNNRYRHVREMYADLEKFHSRRSIRHKIKDLSNMLKSLLAVRT